MVAIVMFSCGYRLRADSYFHALAIVAIIFFAADIRAAKSEGYSVHGGAIVDGIQPVDCERPYPPRPSDYDTREAYNAAREGYYRLASTYVSKCITEWIEASRRQYLEMFEADTRAYNEDRQTILDDMRDAANTEF